VNNKLEHIEKQENSNMMERRG